MQKPAPIEKEIQVRGRKASTLGELEPHFWEIMHDYYGNTPQGHTAVHKTRYRWLLKRNPNSVVYFAHINGTPVAAGLVLQKGQRWYGLAVSKKRLKKIEPKKTQRHALTAQALDLMAAKIANNHPQAWGTVKADNLDRIKFFTDRNWEVASTREQVISHFRKMGEKYSQKHLNIQIAPNPPRAIFTRDNATNGPQYAQVLLLPKGRQKEVGNK